MNYLGLKELYDGQTTFRKFAECNRRWRIRRRIDTNSHNGVKVLKASPKIEESGQPWFAPSSMQVGTNLRAFLLTVHECEVNIRYHTMSQILWCVEVTVLNLERERECVWEREVRQQGQSPPAVASIWKRSKSKSSGKRQRPTQAILLWHSCCWCFS
jgi:hypothetical protein